MPRNCWPNKAAAVRLYDATVERALDGLIGLQGYCL